jgi:chromosome segregation ATPase
MKTIEELEAELETVTRERDRSLFAWESAGMTGRTAQSAMLELTRQLEEACEMVELQNARLDQHHGAEIRMERERDEARAEAERLEARLEAVNVERDDLKRRLLDMVLQRNDVRDKLDICALDLVTVKRERDAACDDLAFILAEYANERNEELTEDALCLKIAGLTHQRDEARAEVERLTRESATLNAMLDGRMPDTWREDIETLTHQLADATNESTHFQVMCKREGEEIERLTRQAELLTDERDELLVRVANQEAELRATREAYRAAYRRGAEAMRGECIGAACGFFMGTTGFCNGDEDALEEVLLALPIPEEP